MLIYHTNQNFFITNCRVWYFSSFRAVSMDFYLLSPLFVYMWYTAIEIESGYDSHILSFKNYQLEVESNNIKSRVACTSTTKIITLGGKTWREKICTFWLSTLNGPPNTEQSTSTNVFPPQDGTTARSHFTKQLHLIKNTHRNIQHWLSVFYSKTGSS